MLASLQCGLSSNPTPGVISELRFCWFLLGCGFVALKNFFLVLRFFPPPKKTMDDQPLRGISNVSIYLQGFCSLHELNLGNTSNYWWMHTKDSRASKRTPVAMYQLCGRSLVYGLNNINFPTYLKMHFVKQISFHNVNE